jgi:hypothetical protein
MDASSFSVCTPILNLYSSPTTAGITGHHDRMARREQLDYLLARLRVQDKYLEVLTEISSNLVAEVSTLYIYSWQVVMQY